MSGREIHYTCREINFEFCGCLFIFYQNAGVGDMIPLVETVYN